MNPMTKTFSLLLLSAIALSGCGEPEDTRPGQPVAHRRHAFKEILKAFEPMGVMLRTDKYDANKFQTQAGQLVAIRDEPWQYFKPDTLYPPSHATQAVWDDPDKFAAEKKAFFDATDKLVALAATPDKNLAATTYEVVADACKSCHKTFKTR